MTKLELIELIHTARGIPAEVELDVNEQWDSLDHLAILARLFQNIGPMLDEIPGVSEANSLERLLSVLIDARVIS